MSLRYISFFLFNAKHTFRITNCQKVFVGSVNVDCQSPLNMFYLCQMSCVLFVKMRFHPDVIPMTHLESNVKAIEDVSVYPSQALSDLMVRPCF